MEDDKYISVSHFGYFRVAEPEKPLGFIFHPDWWKPNNETPYEEFHRRFGHKAYQAANRLK